MEKYKIPDHLLDVEIREALDRRKREREKLIHCTRKTFSGQRTKWPREFKTQKEICNALIRADGKYPISRVMAEFQRIANSENSKKRIDQYFAFLVEESLLFETDGVITINKGDDDGDST